MPARSEWAGTVPDVLSDYSIWCEFTYFLVKPISKLDPIAMRSEPIAGPDADTGNSAPARAALTPHLMLSVAESGRDGHRYFAGPRTTSNRN
jgi:hypothetical protein